MSSILIAMATIALACKPTPITLPEAMDLVMSTPEAIASMRDKGAHLAVDLEETAPLGWSLRVHSTDPCAFGRETCSNLIGYFGVRTDGQVSDLDDRTVTGYQLARKQARLRKEHCL